MNTHLKQRDAGKGLPLQKSVPLSRAALIAGMVCLLILASPLTPGATEYEGADTQERWSIDLRSGAGFATQDLADEDLGVGVGFDLSASYRVMPHLALTLGWGWNLFNAEDSFAGNDIDFEETGYSYGLRFVHPIERTGISYSIEVAGLLNHIEVENRDGDIIVDSGHGAGWQVGAGLTFPIADQWRLTPGVRYRSLSRDIDIAGTATGVDLTYVSAGVRISHTF